MDLLQKESYDIWQNLLAEQDVEDDCNSSTPLLFQDRSPCLAPRNIFILFQVSVSYCPIVAWLVFIFFLGVRFRTPVFDSVLDVVVKFVISTHCSLMKWFIMSTVWKLLKLVFSYPKLFQTSLILLHQSTISSACVVHIHLEHTLLRVPNLRIPMHPMFCDLFH